MVRRAEQDAKEVLKAGLAALSVEPRLKANRAGFKTPPNGHRRFVVVPIKRRDKPGA
jgi:hypothetical protein